jgi:hypothetical protein
VRRLLKERPDAAGLAVPGMPAGSPGMEGGAPQRYDAVLFGRLADDLSCTSSAWKMSAEPASSTNDRPRTNTRPSRGGYPRKQHAR